MFKNQFTNRIASIFLAVTLLFTFAIPSSAMGFDDLQTVVDATGGMVSVTENIPESSNDDSNSPSSAPDSNGENENTASSEESEETLADDVATQANTESSLGNSGELSEAEIIALIEQKLDNLRRPGVNPFLRAAPGDTGSVTRTTITINSYNVNVPGVGNAWGSVMFRMRINGEDAFCTQIWRLVGSGSYTAGNATSGNSTTAKYLANYAASSKSNADYVAAQVLVWESLYGDIGLYSQIIAGTSYESNYNAIKNGSNTGEGLLFWLSGANDQEIVTLVTENEPDPQDPPGPPDDPDDPENPNTETTTETTTDTEVRITEEYDYSDAIGQITIAKRDDQGVSLDGAIFNIHIQFANGETGGDSAFEVYNGSRLFTYTHPRDDHEPAIVTVTETRSPDGYTGSSQPQTAIVHPTYTRVTRVTTSTITITTTTTTVINIDTGEVLASASATAETQTNPPVVKEHADFVEGDRETTLTFVNHPEPCSLTIYKHEKGSYSTALPGARFRIRYADTSVSAQVWELTTGNDGKIVINPLPAAGTLVVEELQSPTGYEIGSQSTFTITVVRGEQKRLDVSNDKRAQLIVYKKDAVSGQFLGGAVFRATLIGQGIVKTAESGADGRALFTDLTPGEWRIEEQTPPPFFLPSTKVETIFIPDGSYETLELTWENEPYSGLTIRKVSYHDGRGLQGAVFGLYRGSEAHPTDFLGEYQTDQNGRIVIDKLESNQYYTIVERQPPHNFLLDEDNSRTILIKPDAVDNNITLIFRNKERPKILIEKVDDLGRPVPNCTFRVSRRDSADYIEVTTGNDGTVLVEGLYEDWYQIVETRAADGVIISDEIKDIETKAGTTSTVQFVNFKQPTLTIQKISAKDGRGLDGAVIRIWREGVDEYHDYTTTGGGYIRLNNQNPGTIICKEIKSPSGFVLSDEEHRLLLEPGGNHQLIIKNYALPELTLRKVDELDPSKGIEGVTFRLTKDGEFRDVTTGPNGIIKESLSPGMWTYQEISVPSNYLLNSEIGYVELIAGEDKEIIVTNRHKPSLRITKICATTLQPLEHVRFSISYKDGKDLGIFTSDENGEIYLENIDPGYIIIKELEFDGYNPLESELEILVEWGKVSEVTFRNEPENPILIKKIDTNGRPIESAIFHVLTIDGGFVAEVKTGRNGYATVTGVKPGWYLVKEIYVEGHILDDTPKQIELKLGGGPAVIEIVNKPLNGIEIYKKSDTNEPLEDIEFTVKKENNLIGVFKTSSTGLIQIPDLEPGFYTVFESAGKEGYLLDPTPKTCELRWGDYVRLEFINTKFSDVQVIKRDSVNPEITIANVSFRIEKLNGEFVMDAKTGSNGTFSCELEPGWYRCFETASVPGYVKNDVPIVFEVKKGKPILLEFLNAPLSGLQILKQDQAGKPLAGIQFTVTELSGKLIGTFTSDETGICFVPDLNEGYYVVTETKGLSTHKPDSLPRNVLVETGKLNKVVYTNYEYPVLVIKKISSDTLKPLGNVRFRLMDKYQREIGIFTTHPETGLIVLTGMDEGKFYLQEVESKEGYKLDSSVREISLLWGSTTNIEIKNTPLASLRIKKVSSEDGKPIGNVAFLLYDMKNNIIGEYVTDPFTGIIELPRTLEAGQYKIKEIRTDPNFVLDDRLRTIELRAAETTELVIENEPKRGEIQITKVASAYNSITKDKEGAVLGGAVFEIYNNKMELVDTIETDSSTGIATSMPLPLGVYGIKEIKSPKYFFTDGEMFYGEVKIHGDLLKFKVKNKPVELETTVEKRGNEEVQAGDSFMYTLSNINNNSNVPLKDFYIHDKLPTDSIRLEKVWTGVWSERVKMEVQIRTNLKPNYRTVAKNLLSTVNNEIDCSRSALGLASSEYVTEFRIVFTEDVQPGFHDTTGPKIQVKVLDTIKNGQKFTNKVDVGGKYEKEYVYNTDGWTSISYNKPKGDLPKTGW